MKKGLVQTVLKRQLAHECHIIITMNTVYAVDSVQLKTFCPVRFNFNLIYLQRITEHKAQKQCLTELYLLATSLS